MISRAAGFLPLGFALGMASCANSAHQKTAPTVTRTAPLITQKAEPPAPEAEEVTASTGKVTRMPLGNFFQIQQSGRALIFDVRPGFFYKLGHVPGSINWPKGRFEESLAIYEPQIEAAASAGKPVILYCTDLACPDALNVANRLAARGHSVSILEGGWDAWKTGGLPTE